ncbi:DUF692 domain-containing protein [Hyphomicrobium sp. CS1GBMeth3]|uniref:MNIO family bufferin maturase n=1 Tax=Hyphomicrobium sp. CS1GBMeth3 TaxID=1892845 RepID=UPI0009312D0E|nr:DUF692 domain-containing protein [Hyphomicrobium sp. CS1GBMeth3]
MSVALSTVSPAVRTIPACAGVGLKPEHYHEILEHRPDIGWFEVHPENYMGAGGPPHHYLSRVRERYPLSLHGVGLSIGAASPLDREHLSRLKALIDRYEPGLFSEHLAWSTHDTFYMNDLLPLPYTEQTLALVATHVDKTQTFLGRRILIENPSTYVRFADPHMTEIEFLSELVRRTGCGLLLDVNNVYVSATNNGYDPVAYIEAFPVEQVGEIHLAGHAEIEDGDGGRLLVDAHDRAVVDPVWALYARAIARAGAVPTLIEWDNDIPTWSRLFAEAKRADAVIERRRSNALRP